MKHLHVPVIALCLFLAVQVSVAQERNFGLGVIVGEPTGVSAKLWTSPTTAVDFALGWSVRGDRIGNYNGYDDGGSRFHFHMDYLWHSFDAISSSGGLPFLYCGMGGRINTRAGYSSSAAVRGVIGVGWVPHETPIDIFLELVPSLQFTSSTGIGFDAGLGARYFF
ncbi:MAG: hypothetical protein ABSF91_13420 [Bacteroidota bacterium]|jgi:hypothetical protein